MVPLLMSIPLITRRLQRKNLGSKIYNSPDKGYIGQDLFKTLWQRGLHLITGIRRNMKNYLMSMADKIMLRKRFVIV